MSGFLGASSPFTTTLSLTLPSAYPSIPCFRLLSSSGELLTEYNIPHSPATLLRMYRSMLLTNALDSIFYDAQRQGRISFYMTNYGEEAAQVGSAAALREDDEVFGQYREAGVFMWRGFTLQQFAHQCFSNTHDLGKGRQMPVHYGSRELHIQTISSPLATQLPHAAGAAYHLKLEGKGRVAICYFGEGAASEGDFHPALNMSATLECPVLFFCRNNGYAISTPTREQYRGDGIASRAHGYGMAAIRVDGNDLLAVYEATALARAHAVAHSCPVLVEAMTYRGGHHSTSDDSTRYRSSAEIAHWADNHNPITRTRLLLERLQLWDSSQEAAMRRAARDDVLHAMREAEGSRKPPISQMFEDVYDQLPLGLRRQRDDMQRHLSKWGGKYGLEAFDRDDEYRQPSIRPAAEARKAEGGDDRTGHDRQ